MNDSEIEIGGTYEVLKRDEKTHRPSPITVKVTGTKDVSSTRKTTRLQYTCERADNGKSVLVKSAKLFQRKASANGTLDGTSEARGGSPAPTDGGSLQVPAEEPLRDRFDAGREGRDQEDHLPAPGGVDRDSEEGGVDENSLRTGTDAGSEVLPVIPQDDKEGPPAQETVSEMLPQSEEVDSQLEAPTAPFPR